MTKRLTLSLQLSGRPKKWGENERKVERKKRKDQLEEKVNGKKSE